MYTRLVDTLFKMLDDRFAKLDDRFTALTSSMDSRVESMTHLEDRLLAKFDTFNGQIGDLRLATYNHEQRIKDHDQRIDDLNSNLLKLESLHKGYKDRTTTLVDTLRNDVNDTRAKIPNLRREVQDSAAELRVEYRNATDGLTLSINDIAAHVSTLRQQQKDSAHISTLHQQQNESVSDDRTTPARGASVDPPPSPGLNCFNLPGGLNPTFRGAASFPSGNCQPRDNDSPPANPYAPATPGPRHTRDSCGPLANPHAPATPSPVTQGPYRRDPSGADLASLVEEPASPNIHHVTFHSPRRDDDQGDALHIVGGGVTSPRPSDKERLARSRGVSLFNIAGLATAEYHGGMQGVQTLTVQYIHNCGYQSFSNMTSPEDIFVCLGEIQQLHRKVLQSWFNPRTQMSGPSLERILDRGLKMFLQLQTMEVHNAVEFYDKFQGISHDYLIPLMPFDAVCLVNNFEGLFVPGLGTQRYHECASALFELLPRLLPTSNAEIQSKLASVRVESKNGYDLLWRVLELTVPVFDPTVPLQQPTYDSDTDILGLGRRFKLYFRLQAKKQVFINTRDCTSMFLKAVASSEYADIVTTLQSNVDSYRHIDDEYFLPQNYRVTNIAMLIHNNTKAQVHDLGHCRINRIAGWDSMTDVTTDVLPDDLLQFCHIQGYEPRVFCMDQSRVQGSNRGGRGLTRRGFDRHQRLNNCQDTSTTTSDCSSHSSALSSETGSAAPRGRFARPDQRRRTFLPNKLCEACKQVGHEAVNCNMLALALFIERHKKSLTDVERNEIESKWLARWKDCLGQPARTPRQVMHTYCDALNITEDTLDLAMDWECWLESDVGLADE